MMARAKTALTRSLICGVITAAATTPAGATVPAGFNDTLVAAVGLPTALAFTPDGRLLVTSQAGTLRVVQFGALLPAPALTFSSSQICTNSERGLLGVAVDPNFASNNFIYLYYTFNKFANACPTNNPSAPVNRVSRFTLPASNVINPATELVLVDNMPSPNGNHNAGDLHFGKDGYLYITIGEGGISTAARDQHVLTGKVLRIASDGSIPATNPFQGAGTARCNVTGSTTPGNKCQETFAWGLRNPFRIAFDLNDPGTRFFINDVGEAAWEEIDLGQSGADYGWNCREGAHSTGACPSLPSMVDPIFEYAHNTQIPGTTSPTNCNCISGGAFVPNGLWPGFDGSYLFGDCTCGEIFQLDGALAAHDFGSGLGTVVHLAFGPWANRQALYYTTYANGGEVRRVALDVKHDFFTLTPCRVVDTRNPAGPYGGPALAAGTTRTFTLAGQCGVPATAQAVAVNLTVTIPNAAGHLETFPAGSTPQGTSVLNFGPGQTRANNAALLLGATGGLSVACVMPGGASTHFILDVVGYFE
jgi:glucose/arabinose dehydrogenase